MSYDQDQADIGTEINERELMAEVAAAPIVPGWVPMNSRAPEIEPDRQALVGAIVAQCGWNIDDLAEPANVTTLIDDTREGLATNIAKLDRMLLLLGTIRDEVAQTLANLMEDDHEAIAGLSVERSRGLKTEWDRDGTWRAVRFAIVERWATGAVASGTPEMVDRVLADVKTAHNALSPSVNGLKALQINPDEFRSTTRSPRWQVKVR